MTMAWGLQLPGGWRSSAAPDQAFGQSLGQYRHLVAAQAHHGSIGTHHIPCPRAGRWGQVRALQEWQGMDMGTPGPLTQMGNTGRKAAWGREHESTSASGRSWSLRSTQGVLQARLETHGTRNKGMGSGSTWGAGYLELQVWSCFEKSTQGRKTRGWAWHLGPAREEETSPDDGPRGQGGGQQCLSCTGWGHGS